MKIAKNSFKVNKKKHLHVMDYRVYTRNGEKSIGQICTEWDQLVVKFTKIKDIFYETSFTAK